MGAAVGEEVGLGPVALFQGVDAAEQEGPEQLGVLGGERSWPAAWAPSSATASAMLLDTIGVTSAGLGQGESGTGPARSQSRPRTVPE